MDHLLYVKVPAGFDAAGRDRSEGDAEGLSVASDMIAEWSAQG